MSARDHLRYQLFNERDDGLCILKWDSFESLVRIYTAKSLESDPDVAYIQSDGGYQEIYISEAMWVFFESADTPLFNKTWADLASKNGMFNTDIFANVAQNVPAIVHHDRLTSLYDDIARVLEAVSNTNRTGASFSDKVGMAIRLEDIDERLTIIESELLRCRVGVQLVRETMSEDF